MECPPTSRPAVPPSTDHKNDPRFPELLAEALEKNGLYPQLHAEMVEKLVTGEADPRQYVCCNSGCIPCSKDYLRAAEMMLKKLAKPATKKKRFFFF